MYEHVRFQQQCRVGDDMRDENQGSTPYLIMRIYSHS
jgi:hypothetical protein